MLGVGEMAAQVKALATKGCHSEPDPQHQMPSCPLTFTHTLWCACVCVWHHTYRHIFFFFKELSGDGVHL